MTTPVETAYLLNTTELINSTDLTDDFSSNNASREAMFKLVNKISYGYVMQSICLLGVFCNILNLFVLLHKKLSESPYVYLTGLAISDLVTLVIFFLSGFPRAHYPKSYDWKFYECFIYFTLGSMSTNVSALLTVVLTIERYIFVSYPMKARTICTAQNARKVIFGVLVFTVLFDMPRFFVFKIKADISLGYTDFGQGEFYQALTYFRLIVVLLGSCVLLTILNVLLIRYVNKSNKKRRAVQSMSNLKRIRDNNRLTMMLVAVIGVYIIGEIPSAFVSRAIIVPLLGEDTVHELSYQIVLIIATLLVVLEHSLNFVVYCIYNKKFRSILKAYLVKIFVRRLAEENGPFDDTLESTRHLTSNGNCCALNGNVSDNQSADQQNTERFSLDVLSSNVDETFNLTEDEYTATSPPCGGVNETKDGTNQNGCCTETHVEQC